MDEHGELAGAGSEAIEFEIRPYRAGDEQTIRTLFPLCFGGKQMTSQTWAWKYRDNPGKATLVTLCWTANGRLIAHYGGIPLPAQLLGKTCRAAQAVDSMCHPSFRAARLGRASVFVRTARRFYADYGRPGCANLVFGFAGARHLKLGRTLLGYTTLCEVAHWQRRITPSWWSRLLPRPGRGRIRTVERFGREADRLWDTIKGDYPSIIVRDAAYLNWRFCACPHRAYRAFALVGDDGGWLAWAVLALDAGGARIVDMLFPPQLPDAATRLIEAVLAEAARAGATQCDAWMPLWAPGRHVLEACRFGPAQEPNGLAFTVTMHDPDLDAGRLAETIYYQMADADIF